MKKRMIVIPIIVVTLIATTVFLLLKNVVNKDENILQENKPEIEALVSFSQRDLYITDGVTIESPQEHKIYIHMDSALKVNVKEKHIKSFKITDFKGESKIGKLILVSPTEEQITDCYSHIFTSCDKEIKDADIKDAGNEINFVVKENPQKYNEVKDWYQMEPKFAIILKDIGSVDYEKKMEAEGYFDSNKYIEYLQIPEEDLNINIQFDIEIEFDDGTKYTKRFNARVEGNKVINDPYYNVRLGISK